LVAAQVVQHDVRFTRQCFKGLAAFVGLDVQNDALLIGVPALEILAVVRAEHERPGLAGRVAAGCGVFYLDDLRTQVREKHGAVGARAELFYRDDAYALQRKMGRARYVTALWLAGTRGHCAGFLLIHCLEMMMRCISLVPSPMQVSGASRYRRSMSYSLEYP